jgi:hypothetical protein
MYAVVWGDTEFQAIGEKELTKGRIIKSPGGMPGFLVGSPWGDANRVTTDSVG